MRHWKNAAVGIVACLLALGPAAPAQPVAPNPALTSAECVWHALPDAARAQLMAAGPTVPELAQAIKTTDAAAIQSAEAGCSVPAPGPAHDDYAQALTFLVVEAWSASRLQSGFGVDEAALRQAWANVPAATRQAVLTADNDPTPDNAITALSAMTDALRLTSPDAKLLVAIYASVRLHLAVIGEPE
jgi:hypothetical protein